MNGLVPLFSPGDIDMARVVGAVRKMTRKHADMCATK